MAAAGAGGRASSLLGSATTWPLKRYGRFLPPTEGDDEEQSASSWKVFESNEESGHLILTIVVSGHFFISQGRAVLEYGIDELTPSCPSGYPLYKTQYLAHIFCEDKLNVLGQGVFCAYRTNPVRNALVQLFFLGQFQPTVVMIEQEPSSHPKNFNMIIIEMRSACDQPNGTKRTEGFSLIDSHKWLKIVRRADCLLLRAHSKNECRLFRVQFGGDSKEQMLERCCSCAQKLAEYVPVQVADERSQQLYRSLHPPGNGANQEQDTEQNASALLMPDEPLPDSCTSLGERRSVAQLAQRALKQPAGLPVAAQRSAWRAEELGPFIRLCLMDQNFPAFVEDVEKELRKLAEG